MSRSSDRIGTTGRSSSTAWTRVITLSQGEQRTLALALRLAGHQLVAEVVGEQPLLLLDDVFSELDAQRAAALVAHLPATQTLVTTAGALPEGIAAAAWVRIHEGRVVG